MPSLLELYQSFETVGRLAEVHEAAQPVLEALTQALGYDRALVALVDPESRAVQWAAGVNMPEELLDTSRPRFDGPAGPLVQTLASGKPIRVDDPGTDPDIPDSLRAYYASFGQPSFVAVPLSSVSGVLVVSRAKPVADADINDLLPFASRLAASMAEHVERRRLRESGEVAAIEKEWLSWMVNAVHDPILVTDEHNNIVLSNTHAERLLQAAPDDSPGKRRAIELNNFLLTAALSSFALDQGAALGRELTLVDPIEGNELLFEVICQPAANLRTGERGLVSVLKDVTDLRRAIDELQRSMARLQAAGEEARRESERLNLVLTSVADPIVVTDPEGRILLMNQPAERLLQPPGGEIGERAANIYAANDAKLSSLLAQLQLEAAPFRQSEIQFVDPATERPLTMSLTVTQVHEGFGQVTAVVSVLHDLTNIRELERRTVEQQLFESEKLAAVGRLAATVAHEINNPLEAISNALYLVLSRTPEDAPNRRFLEIASKETERVSGIIRQMLGFYRPALVRTPTNVNEVLEEVLALMERQLRQRRVLLHRALTPKLPLALASGEQLKQVFLNLILNATEAMPQGGQLWVSTSPSNDMESEFLARQYVFVQFRDSGQGIPEDVLPYIFEPFFSTKREQRGTGLGLWVSQGIIQQHGGQIRVRSRPGAGTTFTIALPLDGGSDPAGSA